MPLDVSALPDQPVQRTSRLNLDALPDRRTSSILGTVARTLGRGVIPAMSGFAGAGTAMTAGAPLIAASGPFAPATALGLGLAGGFGAGALGGLAQESALRAVAPDFQQALNTQMAVDAQQHPMASLLGQLAPQVLALRPSLRGVPLSMKALGGGLGAGMEALAETRRGESLSPVRIGTAGAAGTLLNRPTRLGQRLGLPALLPTTRAPRNLGRQGSSLADEALRTAAVQTKTALQQAADQLDNLTAAAKVVLPEAEPIAQTGTIGVEARPALRDAGRNPSTQQFQFSQDTIEQSQRMLTGLARQIGTLHQRMEAVGDPLSQATTQLVESRLQQLVGQFNREAASFRKLRFAAGRAVKTFDRPPIAPELTESLRSAGALLDGLGQAKARLPLYTNIVRSFRRYPSLTSAERGQLGRDLVDAWRLNLFSVTSWTLDLVGNATELTSQASEAAGRDLGHVIQGRVTFPNLGAFFRALRHTELPASVMEGVGENVVPEVGLVSGGFGRGRGTFTTREGAVSTAVDYLAGSPLYLKGVTDSAARRYGATVSLWQTALEAADAQRLRGMARQTFLREFWAAPPETAITRAITQGNKAGFNRQLSRWERAYASHSLTKLILDPFARWPLQFGRAMAEWLGYNRPLFSRVLQGSASLPEVTGYLVKAATGWGGVALVNELYDGVDFRSMEYVKENGNRVRLSGREPLPTILWLLATIRGDFAKSGAALQYASVPFGRFVSPDGGGGLLGSMVKTLQNTAERGRIDPRGTRRELEGFVNRLVPGQAVLSALKTIFDPTIREGVGSQLPGVSRRLPAAIDPTTGTPLRLTQRLLGSPPFRTIGGTPIPGAERIMEPVQQLLSRFGLLVYRGPKSPIAGIPPTDLPEQFRREWTRLLGKHRQELLLPIAQDKTRLDLARTDLKTYIAIRKEIQALDTLAAKRATTDLVKDYGLQAARPPRRPTLRERQGPNRFRPLQ